MKILAVDYGDSRTGLAVSDMSELLATPITPQIEERSMGKVAEKVCAAALAFSSCGGKRELLEFFLLAVWLSCFSAGRC